MNLQDRNGIEADILEAVLRGLLASIVDFKYKELNNKIALSQDQMILVFQKFLVAIISNASRIQGDEINQMRIACNAGDYGLCYRIYNQLFQNTLTVKGLLGNQTKNWAVYNEETLIQIILNACNYAPKTRYKDNVLSYVQRKRFCDLPSFNLVQGKQVTENPKGKISNLTMRNDLYARKFSGLIKQ